MKTHSPNGKLPETLTDLVQTATMRGWPVGSALKTPKDWRMLIDPLAYAKLETWMDATHLELSGYALLAEPVKADPALPCTFYVKDIMLICTIEESSGGYTEMSADERVQAMMQARSMGYRANQLAWWHRHPIAGWSGIDVDTLRQRIHELGLPEVLQAFAFVRTPTRIRARWDRSGPNVGDNVYVDSIPVIVGTPEMLEVAKLAAQEVETLLARRKTMEPAQEEADEVDEVDVPVASWKREVFDVEPRPFVTGFQRELWGSAMDELLRPEMVEERLAANEDPSEFVCRKEPDNLTSVDVCASCPFCDNCFGLDQADYNQAYRVLVEEADETYVENRDLRRPNNGSA
jgi:hypothetical protein